MIIEFSTVSHFGESRRTLRTNEWGYDLNWMAESMQTVTLPLRKKNLYLPTATSCKMGFETSIPELCTPNLNLCFLKSLLFICVVFSPKLFIRSQKLRSKFFSLKNAWGGTFVQSLLRGYRVQCRSFAADFGVLCASLHRIAVLKRTDSPRHTC